MRYLVANRKNLKSKSVDLLGSEWTKEREMELLKAKTMEDFNKALVGYGVEYCRSISHENDFEYVNLGDTYLNTICYYKGKFRICCYGDIVEEHMDDFE